MKDNELTDTELTFSDSEAQSVIQAWEAKDAYVAEYKRDDIETPRRNYHPEWSDSLEDGANVVNTKVTYASGKIKMKLRVDTYNAANKWHPKAIKLFQHAKFYPTSLDVMESGAIKVKDALQVDDEIAGYQTIKLKITRSIDAATGKRTFETEIDWLDPKPTINASGMRGTGYPWKDP